MSTTFYSPVFSQNVLSYAFSFRTKCVYDVTTSNTNVVVSGTIYLEHKGGSFSPSVTSSRYGQVGATNGSLSSSSSSYYDGTCYYASTPSYYAQSSGVKLNSLATHANWTSVASKSFSFSIPKTSTNQTYYLLAGSISSESVPTSTTVSGASYKTISVPALASYNVTYNANGGSGAPATQKKYYGQTLTLSSTKPTRTNYVFKNWNTASGGTGTTYNPGASYTGNAALTLYAQWYAPYTVTYNANGGSGAPASQTKVYNTNLTLSTTKPTRSNCDFLNWNTAANGSGTAYNPGATYSTNANLSLYAIWVPKPQITALTAVRCDSNGDDDDEGEYCRVECTWAFDTTVNSNVSSGTLTGTITPQGGSATSFTFESGSATTGGGGNATAIVPNLDTDQQYTVTVTVTSGSSTYLRTTSRSVILTRAFFIMDFKAGGTGLGIGRAAPASGLEIGFDTVFDGTTKFLDDCFVIDKNFAMKCTSQTRANTSGSGSTYSNPIRFIDKDNKAIGFLDSYVVNTNGTSATRLVSFTTSSADPTQNVYNMFAIQIKPDGTQSYAMSSPANFRSAIGAVNKAGDTMSGNLTLYSSSSNLSYINKSYVIDIDTTPSANTYVQPVRQYDKDGDEIGHCEWYINTSGELGHNFAAVRQKINGTWTWQQCTMRVNKSGTVAYTILAPDKFRAAISTLCTSGENTITNGTLILKTTNINRDSSNPSATQWTPGFTIKDTDSENLASFGGARETDGRIRAYMWAYNENSSGSSVSNGFNLWVAKDGTKTYSVDSAANFRSAIGAAASSDRRLKSDISPLGAEAVAFVEDLEPVVYTINGERQVGFVAQDIAASDPWGTNMAFETREGLDGLDDWERMPDGSATWKLDYIRTIPPIAAALKQALRRIDQLEELVSELGGNDAQ